MMSLFENLQKYNESNSYDEFYKLEDILSSTAEKCGGDFDNCRGDIGDKDFKLVFTSMVDKVNAKRFEKEFPTAIESALQNTRFNSYIKTEIYKLTGNYLANVIPKELIKELSDKTIVYEVEVKGEIDDII